VFWVVGGIDRRHSAAEQAGKRDEIPANHAPDFAPVIHPTLRTASSDARCRGRLAGERGREALIGVEPAILLVRVLTSSNFVFAISGAHWACSGPGCVRVLVLAFVTPWWVALRGMC